MAMAVTDLKERLAASLDFFKPKDPPLIGVDISSSAIKMVEVEAAGRGLYRVERYAIEFLLPDHRAHAVVRGYEVALHAG